MDVNEIYVVYNDSMGRVRIKHKEKGAVPEVLDGIYTSVREANKAINTYMETVEIKKPLKDKSVKLETVG